MKYSKKALGSVEYRRTEHCLFVLKRGLGKFWRHLLDPLIELKLIPLAVGLLGGLFLVSFLLIPLMKGTGVNSPMAIIGAIMLVVGIGIDALIGRCKPN